MALLPANAWKCLSGARGHAARTAGEYVLMLEVPTAGSLDESLQFVRSWHLKTGFGDQRLKLGALKFFVDGGITAGSAWFTAPYKNRPGQYGIQQIETKMLYELVRLGDELGWQLHFHTCGDVTAAANAIPQL